MSWNHFENSKVSPEIVIKTSKWFSFQTLKMSLVILLSRKVQNNPGRKRIHRNKSFAYQCVCFSNVRLILKPFQYPIKIYFWNPWIELSNGLSEFCSEKQQVSKNGRLQVYVNQSDCVMSILAWRLPWCYRISEHFFNQFYITDAHALISNICVWINSFSFCIDLNFCG